MKFLAIIAAAVISVGCASSVKLDDIPVIDKTGAMVGQTGAGGVGSASGVGNGVVGNGDLGSSGMDKAGPLHVAKIVYFDYDAFVIKSEFQPMVETHAKYLKSSETRRVVIEGHTDDTGGREYNLALGQKRAEAVRTAFGLLGVPDERVEAISFGKEKPAATGGDEVSKAKNRRAELSYR